MKKLLFLGAVISVVLAHYSLAANYTRNGISYRGWPISYHENAIGGEELVCDGSGSSNLDLQGCTPVSTNNNYFRVASELVISLAVGFGLVFGVYRLVNHSK